MSAVLTLDQVIASLEPERCLHPDDLLRIEMFHPKCFTFRCGLCGVRRLPSKRCPNCAVPLKAMSIGAGITVLICSDCGSETLECREVRHG